MKIGICGSGIMALEALLFFEDLGAEVSLFYKENLGGSLKKFSESLPELKMEKTFLELTSLRGREFINFPDNNLQVVPSHNEYVELYLTPIIDLLLKDIDNLKLEKRQYHYQLIKAKVLRVHKCFLNPNDENKNMSRLEDLFRVVYEVTPNPNEDYDSLKIDLKMKESLKEPYEAYKDFDLIIDATGPFIKSTPAGPSNSLAINETKFKQAGIFYGHDSLNHILKFKRPIIVGTDELSVLLLLKMKNHILDEDFTVKIITDEREAFSEFYKNSLYPQIKNELLAILKEIAEDFSNRKIIYEKELFEYRERPDYERAKISCPLVPIPKIEIITNCVASSIDKLFESNDLYLSLDGTPFLNGNKEKTLSCDSIFVAKGLIPDFGLYDGLNKDSEPGFFSFYKNTETRASYSFYLEMMSDFKREILKYFSRAPKKEN